MKTNRRGFLKNMSGTSAGIIAGAIFLERLGTPANAQEIIAGGARPARKSYVTSRCQLELDGLPCGWIWSAEGGNATADVMEVRADPSTPAKKHLGPLKYEEIILYCGAGLGPAFYDWLRVFLTGKSPLKSGSIIYFDSAGTEVSRLNFTHAAITEVTFPALDAKWEENAFLTIKLSPGSTHRHRDKAGRVVSLDPNAAPRWLTSLFRLSIDGLAETTSRATRVEAMTAKREPATGLEISDLVMTFPAIASQPAEAWFEDFCLKGNNADSAERSGKLEFLSPDGPQPLFTLSFENLGIVRLEPVIVDTGTRVVYPLQARMYCEKLRFDLGLAKS